MLSSTQTQLRNGRSPFKVRSHCRADAGRQPIKKWSVSSPTKMQLSPPPALNLPYHSPPLECWVYLCSAARRAINLFTRAREESGNILLPLSYAHLQCCSFSMLSPSLLRPLSLKLPIHSQQSECQQFVYIFAFPPHFPLFLLRFAALVWENPCT